MAERQNHSGRLDWETYDDDLYTGLAALGVYATLRFVLPDINPLAAGGIAALGSMIGIAIARESSAGGMLRNLATAVIVLGAYETSGSLMISNQTLPDRSALYKVTLVLSGIVGAGAVVGQGLDLVADFLKKNT